MLWRDKSIEVKKKTDAEALGIPMDEPDDSELDAADAPDAAPAPIAPAKMLPPSTEKGFSQTVAAVI